MTATAQMPTVTIQAIRSSGTAVFSGSGMPAILTPALALRHLRELSTDVRGAIALDPAGRVLGGDAGLADLARGLLEVARADPRTQVATADGAVLVQRAPAVTFVVIAGPHALVELLSHDLEMLLRDTQDEPERPGEVGAVAVERPDSVPSAALDAAARALIAACARLPRR